MGFVERFPAACPFGATHLALDSRGSSPGGEGDLCRGQGSSSLGVAASVFAVDGYYFRAGQVPSQMVVICLSRNPDLGTQPWRQWHVYEPTVLTQTVELSH